MAAIHVFLSYSHDSSAHKERVLKLAQRLRADGIDVHLDRFIQGTPTNGWDRWMLDELDQARYVLVTFTQDYALRYRGHVKPGEGKGGDFEGGGILQSTYDFPQNSSRFIPIVFSTDDVRYIQVPLRRHTYYLMPSRYSELLDFLTGKPAVTPEPLGEPGRNGGTDRRSSEGHAAFSWDGRPALPKHFVGRVRELSALKHAVMKTHAPIVVVKAVGGQGKTTLVAKWLSEYETETTHQFNLVYYFSAYRFGVEFIGFLEFAVGALHAGGSQPHSSTAVLAHELIEIMKRHPTLIVIDGVERWLQGGNDSADTGGRWTSDSRDEAESAGGFNHLLEAISTLRNGSKLVLTTRATPKVLDNVDAESMIELGTSERRGLSGLSDREGLLLFDRMKIKGSDIEKRACVRELEGHPLSMTLLGGVLLRLGKAIESRGKVYPQLASRDKALSSILQQAGELCGGDVAILQAAAICPEMAPIEALHHAMGGSIDADLLRLKIAELEEWGLLSLADTRQRHLQLHPLVRVHFALTIPDAGPVHARLSNYFEGVPISDRARSLSRVTPRIWSVEHAAAAGDHARAVELLIDKPLVAPGSSATNAALGMMSLSSWFQAFGQSAFELEWTRKLTLGAPALIKRKLLNSMVVAARRCGMPGTADRLIEEALSIKDDSDVT